MHTVNTKVGDAPVHLRGCAVVCGVSLRVYSNRFKPSEFASKTLHEQPRPTPDGIRRKSPE